MTDWPFEQPENEAVLTTRQIVEEGAAILRVSRDDEDGAWQFHTGKDAPLEADARVVALGEIVEMDPALRDLAELPPGFVAVRDAEGRPWLRYPLAEE